MRRMNRFDWLGQFFGTTRRCKPQPKRVHVRREAKPVPVWTVHMPNARTFAVAGHTKSEARAAVKAALALDRLPAGTVLTLASGGDAACA